ncbi:MAG TPA: hypothetical protein ENN60_02845 [archaeon]|nr:hypothetical protein [archaeon]
MNPILILAISGALILLGFLATVIFEKTRISDSLILITAGMLFGRLGWLSGDSLLPFSGTMASLALAIILFEAGLNMDTRNLIENLGKALSLGSISYFIISFLVAGATMLVLGWNPLNSLLLGFLMGGTSAAVIIPIMSTINIKDEDATIVGMESMVTNVLTTVFSLMIVKLMIETIIDPSRAVTVLISSFSTGIVLGVVMGFVWIRVMRALRKRPMAYMLTLAVLFMLYAFTEFSGGNGALASLMFGIMLGNNRAITNVMNLPSIATGRFTKLHDEISFLVRTYFFLYLGLILVLPNNWMLWVMALAITLTSFLGRALPIKLYGMPRRFLPFINKGLSEAVIAVLLIEYGLPLAFETLTIVCLAILLTNIASVPLMWAFVPRKHHNGGSGKAEGKAKEALES